MRNRNRDNKRKLVHQSAKKKIVRPSRGLKKKLLTSGKRLQKKVNKVRLIVHQQYKAFQDRLHSKQDQQTEIVKYPHNSP
jgi:hypothetical protein